MKNQELIFKTDEETDEQLNSLFAIMAMAKDIEFKVVCDPRRILDWYDTVDSYSDFSHTVEALNYKLNKDLQTFDDISEFPLSNVRFGLVAPTRSDLKELNNLLKIPCAGHFVICDPDLDVPSGVEKLDLSELAQEVEDLAIYR